MRARAKETEEKQTGSDMCDAIPQHTWLIARKSLLRFALTLDTGPSTLRGPVGIQPKLIYIQLRTIKQAHTHDRQHALSLKSPLVFRRALLRANPGSLFLFLLWIRPTEQSQKLCGK